MKNTSKSSPAGSVEEYLQALPADQRSLLEKVRQTILAVIPGLEESITYRIPTYQYAGKPIIYFAAFKNHCSLVPVSKDMQKQFEKELRPFHIAGYTVHFTPEAPLPVSLIKKIVKQRIQQHTKARGLALPKA